MISISCLELLIPKLGEDDGANLTKMFQNANVFIPSPSDFSATFADEKTKM